MITKQGPVITCHHQIVTNGERVSTNHLLLWSLIFTLSYLYRIPTNTARIPTISNHSEHSFLLAPISQLTINLHLIHALVESLSPVRYDIVRNFGGLINERNSA